MSRFLPPCILVILATFAGLQAQAFPSKLNSVPINIIGGTPAPLGSVPHQISLLFGGINGNHQCGGSILHENYILTAAHCTSHETVFAVRAGINSVLHPEAGYQTIEVAEVINHENYSESNLQNDISLLRLATPLKLDRSLRTAAIKLPAKGYVASGNVTVTGWGLTKEGGSEIPEQLQTATVSVVSDSDCRAAYGSIIVDTMLCAGLPDGSKDSCQMDSGGPLVEESSGLLVGVVSWGGGCGVARFPGVYTENTYYIDWINKHMV